jgi:hypothetical protein
VTACSLLSSISSRLGRKPAILGLITVSVLGYVLLICSQYLPAWLEASVLVASLLPKALSNVSTMTFIVNVYTVDICSAEER